MKNILKHFFRHRHQFDKPIVSQYRSFGSRTIVFECECGERQAFIVRRNFGDAFPIETTHFLTDKEMKELLTTKSKQR